MIASNGLPLYVGNREIDNVQSKENSSIHQELSNAVSLLPQFPSMHK